MIGRRRIIPKRHLPRQFLNDDRPVVLDAMPSHDAAAHAIFLVLPKALAQPRKSEDRTGAHRAANAEKKALRKPWRSLAGNGLRQRLCPPAARKGQKGERHQIDEPGPPGINPHVILQLRRMRMFPRLRRDDQSYHNAGHQAQKDISDNRCKLKSLGFHLHRCF